MTTFSCAAVCHLSVAIFTSGFAPAFAINTLRNGLQAFISPTGTQMSAPQQLLRAPVVSDVPFMALVQQPSPEELQKQLQQQSQQQLQQQLQAQQLQQPLQMQQQQLQQPQQQLRSQEPPPQQQSQPQQIQQQPQLQQIQQQAQAQQIEQQPQAQQPQQLQIQQPPPQALQQPQQSVQLQQQNLQMPMQSVQQQQLQAQVQTRPTKEQLIQEAQIQLQQQPQQQLQPVRLSQVQVQQQQPQQTMDQQLWQQQNQPPPQQVQQQQSQQQQVQSQVPVQQPVQQAPTQQQNQLQQQAQTQQGTQLQAQTQPQLPLDQQMLRQANPAVQQQEPQQQLAQPQIPAQQPVPQQKTQLQQQASAQQGTQVQQQAPTQQETQQQQQQSQQPLQLQAQPQVQQLQQQSQQQPLQIPTPLQQPQAAAQQQQPQQQSQDQSQQPPTMGSTGVMTVQANPTAPAATASTMPVGSAQGGTVAMPTVVAAASQNAAVTPAAVTGAAATVNAPAVAQVPQVAIASAPQSSAQSMATPQGSVMPSTAADLATAPQVTVASPATGPVSTDVAKPAAPQGSPVDSSKSIDPNAQQVTPETQTAKTVSEAAPSQVVAVADSGVATSQAAGTQSAATFPSADATLPAVAVGASGKTVDPSIQAALPTSDQAGGITLAPEQPSAWWIAFSAQFPQAAQLAESGSFAMVVKGLCMASNIVVQVSPYTQVRRWEMKRDTGEADAAPFVSIGFTGWQWCFYGLFAWLLTKRNGFLILVHSNFLGALLGTYYTIAFYRHCRSKACLDSLQRYLSASMTLALLQVCALLVLPPDRALFLSGLVSSFCSFVGAASMLVIVPTVIKLKDSSLIPAPFAVASFGSSLVWVFCGWMLDDPLVIGPNVFSVFASLVTMYCKWQYPSCASKADKDGLECTDPFEAAVAREVATRPSISRQHEPRGAVFTRKRPSRKPSLPQVPEGTTSPPIDSTLLPNELSAPELEPKTITESQDEPSGISVEDEELLTIASEAAVPDAPVAESTERSPTKPAVLTGVPDGTGGTF